MAYDPNDPRYGMGGYKRPGIETGIPPPPAHSHHSHRAERTHSPARTCITFYLTASVL